ncbi:MarR family transcriptional regulator [uncultured Vibrio sp.]|uniref:MarR family winged helix-turn-helix transcriptional regulator n=1 Tax=uncultured Vibrio sp. TaxID=114054 RepID=UPI0025CF9B05|nr:MarR family transcriptional regulator [uncultured Vibrio sp.]
MSSDKVDLILSQWLEVRPDLDCSSMGVVGRLRRTSGAWQKKLDKVFKEHGLSSIEFDILATMRRCGPEAITPTELYHTLMLSSGAVSTRIEQLVKKGFVERIASEHDRRSCKVMLSKEGVAFIDTALNAHVSNLDDMLSPLSDKEQADLARLLKKILIAEQ